LHRPIPHPERGPMPIGPVRSNPGMRSPPFLPPASPTAVAPASGPVWRHQLVGASLYHQHEPLCQCPGYRSAGLGKNPAESLAAYTHHLGSLLLLQALQIRQTQRLHPLQGQDNLPGWGDLIGSEAPGRRQETDPSASWWAWHGLILSVLGLRSKHNPRMPRCQGFNGHLLKTTRSSTAASG